MKKVLFAIFCTIPLWGIFGCQTNDADEIAPNTDPNLTFEQSKGEDTLTDQRPEIQTDFEVQTETVPQAELKTEPETFPEEEQTSHEQYYSIRHYKEIEVYLRQVWEQQVEENNINSQNHKITTVVPTLKKNGYEFGALFTSGGSPLIWEFRPIDRESVLDIEGFVYVSVYPSTHLYDTKIDNQGYIPNEQGAFTDDVEWYFVINSQTICVRLPNWQSEYEEIAEYFDFEIVTYSPNAETNAVQ